LFSVAVNYGGCFLGSGINRSYRGGVIDIFDFCESDKWNMNDLKKILSEIGIDMTESSRVLWCLPGQSMKNFGLTDISNDEHCSNMAAAVAVGNNLLSLYVDHDDSMRAYNNEGVFEVPSPQQTGSTEQGVKKTREKRHHNYETEFEFDSDGSDFEEDIVDSDFDLYEGDDDLYEDCIDEVEDKKGKKIAEQVDQFESDDDLELPDSDDEQVKFKFKNFSLVDMASPKFKVGQVFASVDLLKKAIREYSCKERVDISMPTNDKSRVAARCAQDCSWYLWASYDSRSKCFMIKRYVDGHTCERTWKVRGFTYKFLAEKYIDHFRADENMNLKNFARIVQKEWNMEPSRPKLSRARRLALNIIYGDEIEQYNLLWKYAIELRKTNPGSTFFLNIDSENRFSKCY
jgi:hypothetical protein